MFPGNSAQKLGGHKIDTHSDSQRLDMHSNTVIEAHTSLTKISVKATISSHRTAGINLATVVTRFEALKREKHSA